METRSDYYNAKYSRSTLNLLHTSPSGYKDPQDNHSLHNSHWFHQIWMHCPYPSCTPTIAHTTDTDTIMTIYHTLLQHQTIWQQQWPTLRCISQVGDRGTISAISTISSVEGHPVKLLQCCKPYKLGRPSA